MDQANKGQDKNVFIYSITCCICSIANSLFISNVVISVLLGIFETIVLFYFLIFKSVSKFILCFLLLTSCAIESSAFTLGSSMPIYSFINLPAVHYYHLFFILLIAYIKLHVGSQKDIRINIGSLSTKLLLLFIVGIIVTIVTVIFNDNGVRTLDGLLRFVIIDCYNTYWICIIFAILWDCMNTNEKFAMDLKKMIIGILTGVSLASVLLASIGNVYIVNANSANLISPLSLFYAPGLLLCYFSEKRGTIYLLLGILASIVQIRYSLGIPGAWWLFFATIVVIFLIKVCKRINRKISLYSVYVWLFSSIGIVFFIACIVGSGIGTIKLHNSYVSYKLSTLLSIFSLRKGFYTWYLGLGASIGVRIEEFVNIFLELAQKPWYLMMGKGYGGSVLKLWGANNWNIIGSTFPDAMINNGVYMFFHTGIGELLINFGLVGVYLVVKLIKIAVKEIFRSDMNGWIVIGVIWMFTLFYIFRSMVIGLACLSYGLYLWKVAKES